MRFIVLGKDGAAAHVPRMPTLAIRIFGSPASGLDKSKYPQLSGQYSHVLEYVFDDIDLKPGETLAAWQRAHGVPTDGLISFDDAMAEAMLTDFGRRYRDVEAVLVHCYMGHSRSPAVAVALDRAYGLSSDFDCREFPLLNMHVYSTIVRKAEEMGLMQAPDRFVQGI